VRPRRERRCLGIVFGSIFDRRRHRDDALAHGAFLHSGAHRSVSRARRSPLQKCVTRHRMFLTARVFVVYVLVGVASCSFAAAATGARLGSGDRG